MPEYKFYTLSDPETNEVRYVGVTTAKTIRNRFYQHKWNSKNPKRCKTHSAKWFKSITDKGLEPIITLLSTHTCDDDSWEEIEINYIKSYPNLTNHSSGGKGVVPSARKDSAKSKCKPVLQIDPYTDIIIAEYESALVAERIIGKVDHNIKNKSGAINHACNGNRNEAYGFRWSWKESIKFPPTLYNSYITITVNNQIVETYKTKQEFRIALTYLMSNFETFTFNFHEIAPVSKEDS